MRRRGNGDSFWVSYSDLATGLVIVFLVVMLLTMAISVRERDAQEAEVQQIVEQLQIILGTRAEVAAALEAVLADSESLSSAESAARALQVDPVTAHVLLPQETLTFGMDATELGEADKRFMGWFSPRYFCALWTDEMSRCPDCARLDPDRPQGIRRVLVVGHGDLKGDYANNQWVSRERAAAVVDEMRAQLAWCRDGGCEDTGPAACSGRWPEVYEYAVERLWESTAGYTRHCTSVLNLADPPPACLPRNALAGTCDTLECESDVHRRVDVILELTGDDMTGMLFEMRALQRAVQQPISSTMDQMASKVVERCAADPENAYHGCREVIRRCIADAGADPLCEGFHGPAAVNEDLRAMLGEVCAELRVDSGMCGDLQ